ncbi:MULTISPECIES: alpha/beta fold hydrolase [Nostocales]|uniref:Alpha/beta fold hydrolase n=4 Tax=Nostocales TaxID=1161 RepID=A0A8S9SVZ4_9CYAN|nr:alpha/beta fold hydrolase [Tolypothrix bouteillei]KAF3883987.1 alpha/beta fold hydrolase [Tolypothrix bouteillei VB521301]
MFQSPDVVWLNTSPSLQCFSQPLLSYLSHHMTIASWDYSQTEDEASPLSFAVMLLHDYLQSCTQPVHLIGHSTGGLLGLFYADRYPEKVKSLTLLAVGVDAAVNWHVHYYAHLPFSSRQQILRSMAYNLFGYHAEFTNKRLTQILRQDLNSSLSPHSLFQRLCVPRSSVPVPLMVCGSLDDIVVEIDDLCGWQLYLKEGDRLWKCPEGKHFFHFFQPQLVAEQVLHFWKSLHLSNSVSSSLKI